MCPLVGSHGGSPTAAPAGQPPHSRGQEAMSSGRGWGGHLGGDEGRQRPRPPLSQGLVRSALRCLPHRPHQY